MTKTQFAKLTDLPRFANPRNNFKKICKSLLMGSKIDYPQLLWIEVIKKVSEKWNEQYGPMPSWSSKKVPVKIAEEIGTIIHSENAKKNANPDIKYTGLSKDTIGRIFKEGGLAPGRNENTIQSFALFVGFNGYNEWVDDIKQNDQKRIALLEELSQGGQPTISFGLIDDARKRIEHILGLKKRYKIGLAFAICIILLLTYYFFAYRGDYRRLGTNKTIQIKERIEQAAKTEFSIYRSVPELNDTTQLEEYFTRSGKARSTITEIARRQTKLGGKLDPSRSRFSQDTIRVLGKRKDTIYVETVEKWIMTWGVTTQYDTHSLQLYKLIIEDDEWKIFSNKYPGSN